MANVLVEEGCGRCVKREEEMGCGCVGGWGTAWTIANEDTARHSRTLQSYCLD